MDLVNELCVSRIVEEDERMWPRLKTLASSNEAEEQSRGGMERTRGMTCQHRNLLDFQALTTPSVMTAVMSSHLALLIRRDEKKVG